MNARYGHARKLVVAADREALRVLTGDELLHAIPWEAVRSVVAEMRLAGGAETLWLIIECDGLEFPIELSEDLPGFRGLVLAIGQSLQGVDSKWFASVAFPPGGQRRGLAFVRPLNPTA